MVTNLQEPNTGRRNLLAGAIRLAAAGAMIYALSKTEPTYAAVKKIADFRDRRGNIDFANSASNDSTITLGVFQGDPANIQDTPTPDATVITAQKDKAVQDAIAAKNANDWWRTNIISLFAAIAGLSGLTTIGVGIWQYNKNQRIDREKREEERFQTSVSGLGKDDSKIEAANTLQIFLQEGKSYEKFYRHCFYLVVANLRTRKMNPDEPHETPDSFNQAIIKLFAESFRLERDKLKKSQSAYDPELLDASLIRLDSARLIGVDLEDAWMQQTSLKNAILHRANLKKANLENADFNGSDLKHTDFTGANLKEAILTMTDLTGAKFNLADLRKADFRNSTLQHVEFVPDTTEIDSIGMISLPTTVAQPDEIKAIYPEVSFTEADLREAILTAAYLPGVNFTRANLRFATLEKAKFNWADFTEAMLTMAELQGIEAMNAKFTRAGLAGANLTGAQLSRATFTETNLSNAKLVHVNIQKADFTGANLRDSDLSDTYAQEANLQLANLQGANLTNLDLRRANLTGTSPEKARTLDGTKMNSIQVLMKQGLSEAQIKECQRKGAKFDPPPAAPEIKDN